MNDVNTLKTIEIRTYRTLDVLDISYKNKRKLLFLYNYEGIHYRLFDCKVELRKFFNRESAKFLEFEDDETLDNYLLNYKINSQIFEVFDLDTLEGIIQFTIIKNGSYNPKTDALLDIESNFSLKHKELVKSYLENKSLLINTNFIFKIKGINKSYIDEVNAIDTATKLKDRINKIEALGGSFEYIGAERDVMEFNLKMVDSEMPQIIGKILLCFYKERISSLTEITQKLLENNKNPDAEMLLTSKIKKLLVDVLLGFFVGTKWNGNYEANGAIVMKNNGDALGFHIVEIDNLKNYLFEHMRLDTPSSTRHRFGKLYLETDGELYFKLNLQLRF